MKRYEVVIKSVFLNICHCAAATQGTVKDVPCIMANHSHADVLYT